MGKVDSKIAFSRKINTRIKNIERVHGVRLNQCSVLQITRHFGNSRGSNEIASYQISNVDY